MWVLETQQLLSRYRIRSLLPLQSTWEIWVHRQTKQTAYQRWKSKRGGTVTVPRDWRCLRHQQETHATIVDFSARMDCDYKVAVPIQPSHRCGIVFPRHRSIVYCWVGYMASRSNPKELWISVNLAASVRHVSSEMADSNRGDLQSMIQGKGAKLPMIMQAHVQLLEGRDAVEGNLRVRNLARVISDSPRG